jgi:hypothetical protein
MIKPAPGCWPSGQKALSQATCDAIDREPDGGEILVPALSALDIAAFVEDVDPACLRTYGWLRWPLESLAGIAIARDPLLPAPTSRWKLSVITVRTSTSAGSLQAMPR